MVMLCLCMAEAGVCQATKDMGKVKRQQSDVLRQIETTSGQLNAKHQEAARQLRELEALDAEIDRNKRHIERMEQNVAKCDAQIKLIADSMRDSEERLARLRNKYAAAVRKMQRNLSRGDRMRFVLSSSSLHEAWRRMRYLSQFAKWRDRQAEQIHGEIVALDRRKRDVEKLRGEQQQRQLALQNAHRNLEQQRSRQDAMVTQLRGEERHLKDVLASQQRRAQALDRELERLIRLEEERIAEEQRKARERQLAEERRIAEEKAAKEKAAKKEKATKAKKQAKSGKKSTQKPSVKPDVVTPKPDRAPQPKIAGDGEGGIGSNFERNKGRLPYPIGGNCRVVRGFGKQRHPELRYVITDNGGIDIEAPLGAVARAVAAGKVSAVFSQQGYGMVVMVRHGNYLTIYVGLESLTVATGSVVEAGNALGTVCADPDDNSRSLLHFEIRREKTKLNPMEWISVRR